MRNKLDAYWFAVPSPEFPRIFISELNVEKFSEEAQTIIEMIFNSIMPESMPSMQFEFQHGGGIPFSHLTLPCCIEMKVISLVVEIPRGNNSSMFIR